MFKLENKILFCLQNRDYNNNNDSDNNNIHSNSHVEVSCLLNSYISRAYVGYKMARSQRGYIQQVRVE